MSAGSMRVNFMPWPTCGSEVATVASARRVPSTCSLSSRRVPMANGKTVSM